MTDNQKLIDTLRKVIDDFEADSKPDVILPDRYKPDMYQVFDNDVNCWVCSDGESRGVGECAEAAFKAYKHAKQESKVALPDRYTPDDLPETGRRYWYVDVGGVLPDNYNDACYDRALIAVGNAYRTKEAAKTAAKRQRIHFWLECLAAKAWADAGKVIDWGDEAQDKYGLYFNHERRDWGWFVTGIAQSLQNAHFPSTESLEAAVQEIGEDDINFYCRGGV